MQAKKPAWSYIPLARMHQMGASIGRPGGIWERLFTALFMRKTAQEKRVRRAAEGGEK